MKRFSTLFLSSALLVVLAGCGEQTQNGGLVDSDTIVIQQVPDTISLPTRQLASVGDLTYAVTVFDTLHSGHLSVYTNLYDDAPGQFTFRGNPRRDARFGGKIKGVPSRVVEVWKYITAFDGTATSMGTWGGGTGWTGQPLYVEWPDSMMTRFRNESPGLRDDFTQREIIVSSLCGNMYFLNFEKGTESRKPIDVGNPIKGTSSLDPTMNGNVYVGQGIPRTKPVSQIAVNLFRHEVSFRQGADPKAWRGWVAYDSSPVVVGGFLFWPGENGTIYKYMIQPDGEITLHTTLQYRANGDGAAGVENSICIYRNYGFFGDNHGDIVCIDLNTMMPLWHYDNHDDIDGSIVCQVEDDVPYLYTGCEVDRQGDRGVCHFIKLNGLDGTLVWEQQIPCHKLIMGGKHFDGGLYCTPLLGEGDCDGMIFANICQPGNSGHAQFTAFDTKTGEIIYQTPLRYFSWTSPVAFYNEEGHLYVFTGDSSGNAYLIEGKTGEILFVEHMVNNFESSPVVVGNELVVGSRGQEIYKFRIQ